MNAPRELAFKTHCSFRINDVPTSTANNLCRQRPVQNYKNTTNQDQGPKMQIVTPCLGSFEERTKTEDIDPPPIRSPVPPTSRDTVRSAHCDCNCNCCSAETSLRSQPSIIPYGAPRLPSAHHQTCAPFACRRRKTIPWIRNASPSHQRRETFLIHCTGRFKLEDDKECIKSSN